jgi:glutathione peroxidase
MPRISASFVNPRLPGAKSRVASHMLHKIFAPTIALCSTAFAADITSIAFATADGKKATLADYKGKAVLIVNVASKCGFTKQYEGLQKLYEEKKSDGLVILGFPCNDFGGQEPGTIQEIQSFCKLNYGVTFPIMGKLSVKGDSQHELYKALTGPNGAFPGNIKWNFGKILIDKNGKPVARFESLTKPDNKKLRTAIEAALAD